MTEITSTRNQTHQASIHHSDQSSAQDSMRAPGKLRYLAAVLYDAILVTAIWFVGTLFALVLNKGQAFTAGNVLYQFYLFGLAALFYIGFWVKRGQTAGMLAWKLKIQQNNGKPLTWQLATQRLLWAAFSWFALGLAYWWLLLKGKTLQDQICETQLVRY
jgi:uncharacterized RDD family membrane protein YckC